ncbi:MAG: cellulase family glycosylhydrolase [Thermoleophilia bacterium]
MREGLPIPEEMFSRVQILVWVLVAAATALPGVPAHAAQKGVATDLSWGLDQPTKDRTSAAVADLGARWGSIDVSWRDAEPAKGVYGSAHLEDVDRAIAATRAAGANVVLTVTETPQWASGNANALYPPTNPADLASFYTMLVARYGATVDAWQVWNEPNHPSFWAPDPTGRAGACAEYAPLLKAAHPVIKAGDPTAAVLFAGLAFNDYAYVERCYDLVPDIGNYFDVMVTHPYAANGAAPEAAIDASPADGRLDHQTFLAYREVRASLLARGSDKPIWFTEMGWSTGTGTHPLGLVSLETQADYLTRAYRLLEQDPYVQVAMWYSLRNIYWANDGPGWLDQLGLMRTDFSPKPSYHAFKAYGPASSAGGPASGGVPAIAPRAATNATRARSSLRISVRRRAARRRARKQTVRIYGRLRGAPKTRVTIRVQRRVGRRWRHVVRVRVRASATGRFTRYVKLAHGRRWRARAEFAGTAKAAPSKSRYVTFVTAKRRR